jgi:hypothetical protein
MLVNNIAENFIKKSTLLSNKIASTDSSTISSIFLRESQPFSNYLSFNKIIATTVFTSAILYLSYKVYDIVSRSAFYQLVKGKLETTNNTAVNSLAPATNKFDHQAYKTRLLEEKAKHPLVKQSTYIKSLLREKFDKIDKLDYEKNINFILEDLDETVAEQIRILILADIESDEYSWEGWITLSSVEINSHNKELFLQRICKNFKLDFKRKVIPTPIQDKSITPAAFTIPIRDQKQEHRSAFTQVSRNTGSTPKSPENTTERTTEKQKKLNCIAIDYDSF